MDGCHGKHSRIVGAFGDGADRKESTFAALTAYIPPSNEEKAVMTLGKVITDTECVFELYVPSDRPQDAKVISRAKVNRLTGEVKVDVFLQPL
jgi:hypothetical protein